eukprot:TRINITY_DN10460_c0_g1_i1.p1 TRINITY_DN10460_c0_g1~~TRINITY_DN10460_c0_g1_i1.p1  ORF type:complete len:302 (+),score=53.20 TRINITY_DN10460_c0_g1_i1:41-907(+)
MLIIIPLIYTTLACQATIPPVFISHGGGPSFFMPPTPGSFTEHIGTDSPIDLFYRHNLRGLIAPTNPAAILVISAHWETALALSISAKDEPTLYYDYSGFPDYTYDLKYPCPHDSSLVESVIHLLSEANIPVSRDTKRGLDHGVFIPLKVIFPEADIPVVQLSLNANLDPGFHYRLGEALAPLTRQNILILGSGQTTHSFSQSQESVQEFEDWLTEVTSSDDYDSEQRKDLIVNFLNAPSGRKSHPRPEHFLPFLVAMGASNGAKATKLNDGLESHFMAMSNFRFDLD